ncbi:MAG: bifunctional precorrin-2 dehydrogenase/sirohydrochlorin ferrochelatase [Candidatus Sumerlaeota bacterium]|nr:bifunctional precorrin-2 dehydrogenase/sirohydrochlorin ferrochelatase [Candidatus Sumerlaeota bacterium]
MCFKAIPESCDLPTMTHYPIFLDLTGLRCVVFGGGAVAERKVEALVRAGARVAVVSPTATARLKKLGSGQTVEWRRRAGTVRDLAPDAEGRAPQLVFLCTNSPQTQRRLARECRRRGILVNVADAPEECDFLVPSVINRGPLQIAISTGGESPSLAQAIRKLLEQTIDPAYEILARLAGELRAADKTAGVPIAERRRRFERLMNRGILETIRKDGEEAGREKAKDILG